MSHTTFTTVKVFCTYIVVNTCLRCGFEARTVAPILSWFYLTTCTWTKSITTAYKPTTFRNWYISNNLIDLMIRYIRDVHTSTSLHGYKLIGKCTVHFFLYGQNICQIRKKYLIFYRQLGGAKSLFGCHHINHK